MQSPSRAAPGSIVGGRYALRTAIGHGGMGTVWRATDTILRREVAVKEVVLPPGLAVSDQEAMYERTLREARAAAGLSHPSIVQVFDVVTEDHRPWIVMELLDARSLADMVLEDGPLAPRAVAKIGIALLGALEIAHAGGVLHRDVKPANVLITSDGRCVLTDFGVAKLPADVQLTTPGMVLGSPHFISPERALGHPFGPPSDLFSLGVTLYTAVEGRPPFDKGDPLSTMHSVVEDPPVPPQRCGPLVDVLYGLMEKDPDQRWDVSAARGVLRELLAGPLAQNASPQHVTDPYSVVPQQAAPVPFYAPAPPPGHKKVGGRAMLHTGESPQTRRTGPRHSTASYPMVEPKRTLDKRMRLALATGVGVVLLIATVSWAMWDKDTKQAPQSQQASSAPPTPTRSPGTEVSFSGITVLGPLGWKQSPTNSYMDIHNPSDVDRRIRITSVPNEKDARNVLDFAERDTLVKNTCLGGAVERVALKDVELRGVKGAELEFKCTPVGKAPRHGRWRMAVVDGKMRHVYLLTWEANFQEDNAFFETAVQSFRLA